MLDCMLPVEFDIAGFFLVALPVLSRMRCP